MFCINCYPKDFVKTNQILFIFFNPQFYFQILFQRDLFPYIIACFLNRFNCKFFVSPPKKIEFF